MATVSARRSSHLEPARPTSRGMISNGLFGMLVFVLTEAMLFAGFISAFTIVKASAPVWPPPDQPRLPVEATAFNTVMLMISGALILVAHRAFRRGDREAHQQ